MSLKLRREKMDASDSNADLAETFEVFSTSPVGGHLPPGRTTATGKEIRDLGFNVKRCIDAEFIRRIEADEPRAKPNGKRGRKSKAKE